MTTPPPGWYPDPETARPDGVPGRERWWDGVRWSERTRSSGVQRGPLVAGIVGALVLAGALSVGGILLFATDIITGPTGSHQGRGHGVRPAPGSAGGQGGENGPSYGPGGPGGSGGSDGSDGSGGGRPGTSGGTNAPSDGPSSRAPRDVPAVGVDLPAPHGWRHAPRGPTVGTGRHRCPGRAGGVCLRGAATVLSTDARAARAGAQRTAEADIARNAATSYDKATYGGITRHRVLRSQPATIAGGRGYRVRWRIENRTKPDAYVESAAFPHPNGSGELLLLRIGLDVGPGAPPQRTMDRIADGVTAAPTAPSATPDGGDGAGAGDRTPYDAAPGAPRTAREAAEHRHQAGANPPRTRGR